MCRVRIQLCLELGLGFNVRVRCTFRVRVIDRHGRG